MRRKRWLLISVAIVVVGGVSLWLVGIGRPSFAIDRSQPFWVEFGRGSGWHGLETIKVDQTGRVVLHRMKSDHQKEVTFHSWQIATLQLSPEALAEILEAVDSNGLLALRKSYHANIHDGTQWVLWIKQGEHEKSVYFNNNFPRSITAFADQLDAILGRAGLDDVAWESVPDRESRQHERELWDSIRRYCMLAATSSTCSPLLAKNSRPVTN